MSNHSLVYSTVTNIAERYVGRWKPSGPNNVLVNCPFHEDVPGHHSYTLSISVLHGKWTCFSCGAGGGLNFFLEELGVPADIRKLYLEPITDELLHAAKPREVILGQHLCRTPLPEALLGVYEYCPVDLVDAGFDEELLREHDVGFDMDRSRITWPVRDLAGSLAGIMGRGGEGVWPKYRAYKRGNFRKVLDYLDPEYDFQKSHYLWNLNRFRDQSYLARDPTTIVCEGFKAGLWCIQHGYKETCAVMGSRISRVQAMQLRPLGGTVILLLDHNTAGRAGAASAYDTLVTSCDVLFGNYPDEEEDLQPDDLTPEELSRAVLSALTFTEWIESPPNREAWQAWRRKRYGLSQKRWSREEQGT